MHTQAVVLTTFLQQCNKALHGEPFSMTVSYGSASLLPVVDVNGVLLVAAAPLQAFLTYVAPPPLSTQQFHPSTLGNLYCYTGPLWVTLAIPQLETRGNPSAVKMNNYIFPSCHYPQSELRLSISSSVNGMHMRWGIGSCREGVWSPTCKEDT